jgi:hypothetical protein
MKSFRVLLCATAISVSTIAFAQTHDHKSEAKPAPTEAQLSFDKLKALAGNWEGKVSMTPPMPGSGDGVAEIDVTLRVTSRGNALVHEMHETGKPDDPKKYDHPVTMFYLDNDKLLLTHYCDAGNRPRMVARDSGDGKAVEFDFIDVSGSTKYGNMYHAVITPVDADHHIEEWTFMLPGDKPMRARMELHRKN